MSRRVEDVVVLAAADEPSDLGWISDCGWATGHYLSLDAGRMRMDDYLAARCN